MVEFEVIPARTVQGFDGEPLQMPEIVQFKTVDENGNIHRGTFIASETTKEVFVTRDGRKMTARQIKAELPLPPKARVTK